MKRDPNYIISWKDWLQIIGICIGVGFATWLAIVIALERGWVEWIQAFLS